MLSSLRRSAGGLIRRVGGYAVRRAGFVPAGMPNGFGQDAQLAGRSLPHTVMVFFPDPPGSIYQLAQWYSPLRALNEHHRVVIVTEDSRTAAKARQDSGLDVITVASYRTMDGLLARSNVAVALYVGHHQENFSNLRFSSLVHASLLHGDSDKMVSVTHQTNGYDFSFVAGQAAVDRMDAFGPFFDARTRCIPVGRPPLDDALADRHPGPRDRSRDEPLTVLYAPTWEGAQPSVSYSSIDTHGVALVDEFLAARWRVIYRPHSFTRWASPAFIKADDAIRARLTREGAADGRHRIDDDAPLARSFNDADLLVTDISGIAVDWLVMDRPLMITAPDRAAAVVATTALTASMPRIASVPGTAARARAQVAQDPLADERRELTTYYLGDTAPGAATQRFIAAVEQLMAAREAEQQRLRQAQQALSTRSAAGRRTAGRP